MPLIRKTLPLLPINGRELLCAVRETSEDELSLAEDYIAAAQNALWTMTQRVAHTSLFELTLPCFPGDSGDTKDLAIPFTDGSWATSSSVGIELRAVPFTKLVSVKYVDVDGVTQTLDSSLYYILDGGSDSPATLYLNSGEDWPKTKNKINAVTIQFYAGEVTQVTVDGDTFTSQTAYVPSDGDEVTISHSGNTNAVTGEVMTPVGTKQFASYYVINSSGSDFQLSTTSDGSAISLDEPENALVLLGTLAPVTKRSLFSLATDWWLNRCPAEDCDCMTGDAARLASRLSMLKWNTAFGD